MLVKQGSQVYIKELENVVEQMDKYLRRGRCVFDYGLEYNRRSDRKSLRILKGIIEQLYPKFSLVWRHVVVAKRKP